jgi:S-methylmethionine-dependent homocysteine/selenocysteine methylase
MSAGEAEDYHADQIGVFAEVAADMVPALTMTNANEAIGIVRAARGYGVPAAISFTVETDGRLPTGQALEDAVAEVDAATGAGAAYYMINCAHPTHFVGLLRTEAAWTQRIRGLRANASRRSHQELNDAPDLDAGDPAVLGDQYREIVRRQPQITVLGGCCGTDHRHIEHISSRCRSGRVSRMQNVHSCD